MFRITLILVCLMVCLPLNLLNAAEVDKANVLGVRVVDVEGGVHHLGSGFDAKPVTILFLNTHCPIARKYIPTLNELSELAKKNGMDFYAVVSDPDVTLAQVNEFKEGFSIAFPVIFDSAGDLSKRLKPKITPEAYVINREDVIAYQGRIDNGSVKGVRPLFKINLLLCRYASQATILST